MSFSFCKQTRVELINAVLALFVVFLSSLAFADQGNGPIPSPADNDSSMPLKDMTIDVRFRGEDDILEQCIENGLTVKYRYSLRLCKSRLGWFSTCLDTRRQIHHLESDPIRNAYRLSIDRLGDSAEPVSTFVKSKKQAYLGLSTINALPLKFVGASDLEFARSKRGFLDVRVESHCQGRYNKTLARISYFLTLGLIDIIGFDSGWQEFSLDELHHGGSIELK